MEIVHYSVMMQETRELLGPVCENGLLIDCTLGEGGHSEQFLKNFPHLKVIGLDRDSIIIEKAKKRLAVYGDRFQAENTWFDDFLTEYPDHAEAPSAILFDLGISVFHYEESGRGFSFRKNEPLDMRLSHESGLSAAELVNNLQKDDLANIIFNYGEERYSRRIASAICEYRARKNITSSDELAEIIRNAVPPAYRRGKIHPATKTFQAIRIEVNGELARIERSLEQALRILKPGGRVGVISFHSLEDRKVKWFFRKKADGCVCPPNSPRCTCEGKPQISILTKKPIVPSEEEIQRNSPSRSAKLRVVEKIDYSQIQHNMKFRHK